MAVSPTVPGWALQQREAKMNYPGARSSLGMVESNPLDAGVGHVNTPAKPFQSIVNQQSRGNYGGVENIDTGRMAESAQCVPSVQLPARKTLKLKPAQIHQLRAQILACMQVLRNWPVDPQVLRSARDRLPDGQAEVPEDQMPVYQFVIDDVDVPPQTLMPRPEGIDVKRLAALREVEIQNEMAARQIGLEHLDPRSLTVKERLSALMEIRALSLAEEQAKLRQQLIDVRRHYGTLETELDPRLYRRSKIVAIHATHITEVMEMSQRLELEQRKTRKQRQYLESVLEWGKGFAAFHQRVKAANTAMVNSLVASQRRKEMEKRRRQEAAERERMRFLMEDNEEEYRKLVKEKKDERLSVLLEETDKFVKKFSSLVKQRREKLKGKGDVVSEEDKKKEEEVIQSIVNGDDSVSKTYYLIAHTLGEKIEQQPALMTGGTLKHYQMQGLEWMVSLYNNCLNGILADEMGLGKTIQTIALLCYLIEKKNQRGPFLITVPLSTMTNWQCEFAKWAPSVDVVRWEGKPAQREMLAHELHHRPFNVLMTSYEYIMQDKAALSKFQWVYLVVDEGHRIKNEQAKLTKVLNKYYKVDHRLLLTGTPLQNKLHELWALMSFLMPDIFNREAQSFDEWLAAPFANTGLKPELNSEEKMLVMGSLHKVLRPFILKRMKVDVAQQLPQKTEYVIRVRMSALQESVYNQVKDNGLILAQTNTGGAKMRSLSNVEMHLRKILNHPYLFKEIESVINPNGIAGGAHLYRTCGKFEVLDRMFTKLKETGHRVLLFCQMTSLLDVMEDFLSWKGLTYIRLDGSTNADERGALLTAFNAPNSDIFVFLLSTRAGGLGLNLQSADTVILYDSDWNPFQDLQAQDRAHRIGQKNEVRVIRLVTVGPKARTVEECILDVAQRKLHVDAKVIQAGRFDNKTSAEERRRILESLVSRDEVFDQEDENRAPHSPSAENEMLARTPQELELFEQIDEEFFSKCGGQANRLMKIEEVPPVYIDSGEKLENLRREDLTITYGRGRRERKEVVYNEELDDDTWAKAVDQGNLDELIEQRRQKNKRRSKASLAVGGESDRDGIAAFNDGVEVKKRGRGRPREKHLLDTDMDTDAGLGTPSSSRTRAGRRSIHASGEEGETGRLSVSHKGFQSEDEEEEHWTVRRQNMYIIEYLIGLKDEDGGNIVKVFMRLPKRNEYADYYDVVANPISMAQIRTKACKSQYSSVDAMEADLQQMFENAHLYNEENSWVVANANKLKAELAKCKTMLAELVAQSPAPAPPTPNKPAPALPSSMDSIGRSCKSRSKDKQNWCSGCRMKQSCERLKSHKVRTPKHHRPSDGERKHSRVGRPRKYPRPGEDAPGSTASSLGSSGATVGQSSKRQHGRGSGLEKHKGGHREESDEEDGVKTPLRKRLKKSAVGKSDEVGGDSHVSSGEGEGTTKVWESKHANHDDADVEAAAGQAEGSDEAMSLTVLLANKNKSNASREENLQTALERDTHLA